MSAARLFIGIAPPEAVRTAVASLNSRLRGVRWTPVDQIHVTLRFLGNVAEDRMDDLLNGLSEVRVDPFLLPVEGVGAFPQPRAPRVLWVGVGSGHPLLHQLRQRLDDTLLRLGFEVELRSFHPHLTVARCNESAGGASQWLRQHEGFLGPPFMVDGFELYASELAAGGAVHHLVSRFPFAR
jgi:2'-5' RNA ligase